MREGDPKESRPPCGSPSASEPPHHLLRFVCLMGLRAGGRKTRWSSPLLSREAPLPRSPLPRGGAGTRAGRSR